MSNVSSLGNPYVLSLVRDTASEEPFWQTTPCPPWCTFTPHVPSEMGEDRTHFGPNERILLTLEDLPRETYRDDKGKIHHGHAEEPEHLSLHVIQHYREYEPHIWLGRNETNNGVNLTLTEAQQLARTLLELARYATATESSDTTPAVTAA